MYLRLAVMISCVLAFAPNLTAQSTLLDNAEFFSVDLEVRDAVYDPFRDVVYATTASTAAGGLGNRLVTIDPSDGNITDSIFVGSSPNRLAISSDSSRVYIGIDGASGFRSYSPVDNTLTDTVSLFVDNRTAVASDLAVSPTDANTVVVSRNPNGISSTGFLQAFENGTSTSSTDGGGRRDIIEFVDSDTLFTFTSSTTAFSAVNFNFDGSDFTFEAGRSPAVSRFSAEPEVTADGRIVFTNGVTLDAQTLEPVGTFENQFNVSDTIVESISALGLTYFAGPPDDFSTDNLTLSAFDDATFTLIDSVELTGIESFDGGGDLFFAGENRLGVIASTTPGEPRILSFVGNIPATAVPEPSSSCVLLLATTFLLQRRSRICLA